MKALCKAIIGIGSRALIAPVLLVGGALILLSAGSGAPASAAPSDNPTNASASGPQTAHAPSPILTRCVPSNANYVVRESTGATLVPGTTDIGLHCGECSTTINLPFAYTLYDRTFTTAIVTSKGTLGFVDVTQAYWSDCLPDEWSNYAIFPHWDDLDLSATCGNEDCGVYTSVSGQAPNRIFNIEWRARYHNMWNTLNFEVRLYEGLTRFDLVYGFVTLEGYDATVGVQRDTGSRYTQFSCWGYVLPEGLQLSFKLYTCSPSPRSTPPPATQSSRASTTLGH